MVMNQIFLKAIEVGAGKEKLFEVLKDTVAHNSIEIDDRILNDVYLVACKAYEGKRRYSGEEYVTHPLNVAILLAELGAESDIVMAGLFCDVKTKGNNINLEKELHPCRREKVRFLPIYLWVYGAENLSD